MYNLIPPCALRRRRIEDGAATGRELREATPSYTSPYWFPRPGEILNFLNRNNSDGYQLLKK